MEKPLVDKEYLLEKFPGKGGWTYALIPEIEPDKHAWFGWVKTKGNIDGVEFSCVHLMPFGNGQLFFPVKKEIRRKIGKQEGDTVRIIIFKDESPFQIPEEFLQCLQNEPDAFKKFKLLSEGKQKEYSDWIYSAKTEETRVNRILRTIERIT